MKNTVKNLEMTLRSRVQEMGLRLHFRVRKTPPGGPWIIFYRGYRRAPIGRIMLSEFVRILDGLGPDPTLLMLLDQIHSAIVRQEARDNGEMFSVTDSRRELPRPGEIRRTEMGNIEP